MLIVSSVNNLSIFSAISSWVYKPISAAQAQFSYPFLNTNLTLLNSVGLNLISIESCVTLDEPLDTSSNVSPLEVLDA